MIDPSAWGSLRLTAIAQAGALYRVDAHPYGRAQTAFVKLKCIYGLAEPSDPAPAVAFHGGIAYSGGPCGDVTGVARAVGMLAAQVTTDHGRAKTVARELICSDLRTTGQHGAFLESGCGREACALRCGRSWTIWLGWRMTRPGTDRYARLKPHKTVDRSDRTHKGALDDD